MTNITLIFEFDKTQNYGGTSKGRQFCRADISCLNYLLVKTNHQTFNTNSLCKKTRVLQPRVTLHVICIPRSITTIRASEKRKKLPCKIQMVALQAYSNQFPQNISSARDIQPWHWCILIDIQTKAL